MMWHDAGVFYGKRINPLYQSYNKKRLEAPNTLDSVMNLQNLANFFTRLAYKLQKIISLPSDPEQNDFFKPNPAPYAG